MAAQPSTTTCWGCGGGTRTVLSPLQRRSQEEEDRATAAMYDGDFNPNFSFAGGNLSEQQQKSGAENPWGTTLFPATAGGDDCHTDSEGEGATPGAAVAVKDFMLTDPGVFGIFSEQVVHFKVCHDVITVVMGFMSPEEQLAVRRVSHRFMRAVDDVGSSRYTTRRVTQLVAAHNSAALNDHQWGITHHVHVFSAVLMTGIALGTFQAVQSIYSSYDDAPLQSVTAAAVVCIICMPEIGAASAFGSLIFFRKNACRDGVVLCLSLLLFGTMATLASWFGGMFYSGRTLQHSPIGVAECLGSNYSFATGDRDNYYSQVLFLYPRMWAGEGKDVQFVSPDITLPYRYTLLRVENSLHEQFLEETVDCVAAMSNPLAYATTYEKKVKGVEYIERLSEMFSDPSTSAVMVNSSPSFNSTSSSYFTATTPIDTVSADGGSSVISSAAASKISLSTRFSISAYHPDETFSWSDYMLQVAGVQEAGAELGPTPSILQVIRESLFWGTVSDDAIEQGFYKGEAWTSAKMQCVSSTVGLVEPCKEEVIFHVLVVTAYLTWAAMSVYALFLLTRVYKRYRLSLLCFPHERSWSKSPLTRREAFLLIRKATKAEEEASQKLHTQLERVRLLRERRASEGTLSSPNDPISTPPSPRSPTATGTSTLVQMTTETIPVATTGAIALADQGGTPFDLNDQEVATYRTQADLSPTIRRESSSYTFAE